MIFEKIKAEDLIEEISMGPFGSNIKKECFVDSGVAVLNGSNLNGIVLNEDSFGYVTEEKADSLGKANASRGDVVITHRGTLGQVVFIPQNSSRDRYVISQSQFRVRCNDRIMPEYMTYFLHTPIGQNRLLANASQVGVPALARASTTFKKIVFDVPAIGVQKKIVSLLESFRLKIEKNAAINRNLQEQAQAYFDELFDTNEGLDGTLSDVGTIVAGGTPSKARPEYYTENGIAWITPKDLSVDRSVFIYHGENDISDLGYSKSSATKMPEGTVLFSSRAPIGYIAIAGNEVTTNQGFKSVVPNEDVGTAYIYFLLKKLLPIIESMASGSTFKEISGSAMKMVPISIPDKDSLKDFNAFCMPLFEEIKRLEQEAKRLSSLRDALLPKLMSGELDVSDIDI